MVNYGLDISDSNRITYATHEFESEHHSLKDLNSSQIGLGFKDLNIRSQRKLCPYPTNPNWNPLKIRVRIRFSNFSYTSEIKRFRLDFIIIVMTVICAGRERWQLTTVRLLDLSGLNCTVPSVQGDLSPDAGHTQATALIARKFC